VPFRQKAIDGTVLLRYISDMEKNTFSQAIVYKIIYLLLIVFNIYCLMMEDAIHLLFISSIIVFLFFFYFLNIKYIFEHNNLTIKLPFLKGKMYNLNNLIGYSFISETKGGTILYLFFINDEKTGISLSGKKMKNYILNLLEKKRNFIKQSNINTIIENGLKFRLDKKQEIIFKKDYMEIIEKENFIGTYYYATDIKRMEILQYSNTIFLKIDLNDNRKIRFNDYKLKGGIGLFKYLIENVRCPNGT
jgi:hypothetical protein